MKLRFQDRLQKARDYHLSDAVRDRWDTQRSCFAVAFGDLDATYRRRKVAARCHPIPKLVEIQREVLFKLRNRLTIDASGSPVGLDSFVRIPNVAFGNVKWLRTTRGVHPIAG